MFYRYGNRLVPLAYRLVLTILCFCGLYLSSGIPEGNFQPIMFAYFTILSNIFVFIFFLLSCINSILEIRRDGIHGETAPFFPRIKGGVIISITVTFIIYAVILGPGFSMSGGDQLEIANLLVHYIVPIMVIADWIIFDRKGTYGKYDPLYWLGIFLAYFAFVIVRAAGGQPFPSGSMYPYPFIDIDKLGIASASVNIILMAVFLVLLGYLFYWIDRKLGERTDRR